LLSPRELVDQGAQPERTALSWLRTAASITFAALLAFRYLIEVGNFATAYLLTGAAMLVAPSLLLVGRVRADRASNRWPGINLANPKGTLLVAIAVCSFGVIVAVTIALG
jgi:uncharacterized membrane protein YidH (DUF202 family)